MSTFPIYPMDSLDPQLVTRWSAGCLNAVGRGGTSGSLSVGSIDNSSVDWLCGLGQYLQGPVLIALRLMLWAFFFFFGGQLFPIVMTKVL